MTKLNNVEVFAMINGHRGQFRELALNKKNKQVMFVRQGGKNVPRTQILCSLEDDFTEKTGEEIYKIVPLVEIPQGLKFFFQLQAVEISEPNCGKIICNRLGQKLPVEWTNGPIAGFRTVHDVLYVVEASALRDFGTIIAYSIVPESDSFYLLAKKLPVDFRVTKTAIEFHEETPTIKWTNEAFFWIADGNSPPEHIMRKIAEKNFTLAAEQAWFKASHNCFYEECPPHYAITDLAEKNAYWDMVNATRKGISAQPTAV
ncbi:MAG: hypothetical protein QMD65_00175 [Patescibacteria group bacterium]|nr:hypothetical protein [Patescibacteria group bacterium]